MAAEEKPFFAVLGCSGKMNVEGFYEVSQVSKDSLAEKQGLRIGDCILAVDGVSIKSLEALRLILAQKNWGDVTNLEIRKKLMLDKE